MNVAAREMVTENSAWMAPLREEVGRVIVGQKHLLDRLLIAMLTNGHVLLEGVPGLAKTLTLKTLASCISVRFKRLQFTPDMLPSDLLGTMTLHGGEPRWMRAATRPGSRHRASRNAPEY